MSASDHDERVGRPPSTRALTAARDLSAATPLRIKLVVVLLALVTVALAASGAVAAGALRSYLANRLDAQLQSTAADVSRRLERGPLVDRAGRPEFAAPPKLFLRVVPGDGSPVRNLRTADVADPPALPAPNALAAEARGGQPFTVPSDGGDTDWRAMIVPLPGNGTLVVALSLEDVENTVSRLVLIEAAIGVLVLLVLAGVAYAVVGSSLRPLAEVEETAAAIAAGDLARRVPDQHPETEVGRLSQALNAMLTRIESAFRAQEASEAAARASEERMRRFVADASHELRTPLTSIRGFAELYRQGAAQTPEDVARSLRRIEDEAARMGLLVDDLLLLARLDQQRPLERLPVDLVDVAADAVADARVVAPDRPIELTVREGMAPQVLGDEGRLRQVVGNLMSNALTHTPGGTAIKVAVGAFEDDDCAIVSVADSGPGLAPEHAARVFQRFYRVDASRTRSAGGTGLGLSIVAALVTAHGGSVDVKTAPQLGCAFTVRLPLWRGSEAAEGAAPPAREQGADEGAQEISSGVAGGSQVEAS